LSRELDQPPSDQPGALALGHFELLNRNFDRRLLIRLIVDDANELSPASRGAVNAPGVAFRLLGRFVHSATIAEKGRGGISDWLSSLIFDLDQRSSLAAPYRAHAPGRPRSAPSAPSHREVSPASLDSLVGAVIQNPAAER
jgi:hypothetical protein